MLQVVILAGGLATRLYPITEKIPKSLVEVAGFPFIHHQLNYLKKQGIEEVVICLGYLGELVEEFISKQSYGLNISFSYDGVKQLGTGGALKNALNRLSDQFFIIYGDSFLPIDYLKVYRASVDNKGCAIMVIFKNNNKFDVSNVKKVTDDIIFYDKKSPGPDMKYIDYGLSIASKKMIEDFKGGSSYDLSDLMHKISIENKLIGFEVTERFYEIGSHNGLAETRAYFLKDGL